MFSAGDASVLISFDLPVPRQHCAVMRFRRFVIPAAALLAVGIAAVVTRNSVPAPTIPPPTPATGPRLVSAPTKTLAPAAPTSVPVPAGTSNSPTPSPVVANFLIKAREAQTALANAALPAPALSASNLVAALSTVGLQVSRGTDGSTVLDQVYVVRGQGTAADPCLIGWDLLLSGAETFAPAAGKWELPERVRWLDGKQVQLKGFLTSPVRATKSDHLLLTWSALDACCLGGPPAPCQAVEVKLQTPLTLERHVLIGVTVEGTFKLETRLQGGLGLSLYRLNDARVVGVGR